MKVVFTIVVVLVVWNGFKYFTRMQEQRSGRVPRSKPSPKAPEAPAKDGVEDMVECKACGAYTTRSAKSCGRQDCPF
ncbi:MAG: hypothetical protein OQK24_04040 [Magnetovibrio sp.]|nr:hypothetical protein [Magnetovibrio sp.]